jgi:DNA-binding XRE family transcriptional regulator
MKKIDKNNELFPKPKKWFRKVLSKKKMTKEEAARAIEVARKHKIELAEEMILTYQNIKELSIIDLWILHQGGFATKEAYIEYCKQEIDYWIWKISEDYSRFLN